MAPGSHPPPLSIAHHHTRPWARAPPGDAGVGADAASQFQQVVLPDYETSLDALAQIRRRSLNWRDAAWSSAEDGGSAMAPGEAHFFLRLSLHNTALQARGARVQRAVCRGTRRGPQRESKRHGRPRCHGPTFNHGRSS